MEHDKALLIRVCVCVSLSTRQLNIGHHKLLVIWTSNMVGKLFCLFETKLITTAQVFFASVLICWY